LAYFTIGDSRVFLGTVGLLNSLRLSGNDAPLVVMDAGFTPEERALLTPHCSLVDAPDGAAHPTFYKPFPHLTGADGVVVLLDSDALITTPLDEYIELARGGALCAFPDPDSDRFFPEWAGLLGLRAELRPRPCVSAGFLVFSTDHWPGLLRRWWEVTARGFDVDPHTTEPKAGGGEIPLFQRDQDTLNALLMSEFADLPVHHIDPGETVLGPEALAVRIRDTRTLRCERQGQPVMFVHTGGTPKPWEAEARSTFRADAYLTLLRRLLFADDVPLRLDCGPATPLWLRPGAHARAYCRTRGTLNAIGTRPFWAAAGRRYLAERHYQLVRGLAPGAVVLQYVCA
jgi:hypothetical protein